MMRDQQRLNHAKELELMKDDTETQKADMIAKYEKAQFWLLTGCIVVGILALCFLCCVCIGRSSLALAIDVIDASADFLWATKRLILVPVLYFFITLIFMIIWFGAMGCVISMNTITINEKIP